jgi:pyruvate kinase
MIFRRTKIVCTIGPACDSEEMITKLVTAGMNVARVNFSHGTHEYHRKVIHRIKAVRKALNKPVAILQDLQGPKIRIGLIRDASVELKAGREFILTTENVPGDEHRVSVSLKTLPQEVSKGDPILLADGNIELRVEKIAGSEIYCRVIVGGQLSSHKGINLPGSKLQVDSITKKDREDIAVGVEEGVDAIALSFVRSAADLAAARNAIKDAGGDVPIIAKIEKPEAVENIEGIVAAAQGVMVAGSKIHHSYLQRSRQARDHRNSDAGTHGRQPEAHTRRSDGCGERDPRRNRCGDVVGGDGSREVSG